MRIRRQLASWDGTIDEDTDPILKLNKLLVSNYDRKDVLFTELESAAKEVLEIVYDLDAIYSSDLSWLPWDLRSLTSMTHLLRCYLDVVIPMLIGTVKYVRTSREPIRFC